MKITPVKVLIVDDEPLARKYVAEILREERGLEIVGEATNGKIAARMIAKERPDLVILDIQMPEMDGFETLAALDPQDLPVIIFTTAFEEYAIRAFEVHAIDYLLKPFDQPRFAKALSHARRVLGERTAREQEGFQISELLDSISRKPRFLDRLLIKQKGRIVFLKVEQIEWIRADDKYVHLYAGKSRQMIRQSLSSLKSQLDPSRFVQLSRSVIANVDCIKELHAMFNGDYEVQMSDGTTFALSRNHKNDLFELLGRPFS